MQRNSEMTDTSTEFAENTKSSFFIMICTMISRILGIVRVSLISSIFGATGIADVINFTFNIPNNLRKMLAEGALSSAFIPMLSKAIIDDTEESTAYSKRLVREMITVQILIFIPVILLTLLFSEQIIGFLSSFQDQGKLDLSAMLLRFFIFYLLMISCIAIINAALNCNRIFFITAFAPLLFSVSVIVSLKLFAGSLGALAMVIGVLSGGLLQLAFVLPAFYRIGYRLSPVLRFSTPYIKRVMLYWIPVMATSTIAIINQQFAYFFASGLQEGSITAFSNSIIFWQLPYGLFFNSVATVYFPIMSRSYHEGDMDKLSLQVEHGIEHLLIFLIPSTLLLLVLSNEFVSVILFRGAYTLENTILTARTVRMFSVGLLFVAVYNYMLRFFYSTNQFKITILSSSIVAAADIIISVLVIRAGLDVSYLALANSLSFLLGVVFLLLYMKQKTSNAIRLLHILKRTGYILLLNVPLILGLYIYKSLDFTWWQQGSSLLYLLATCGISLFFGLVIIAMYKIGHIEIVSILLHKKGYNNH